MSWYREGTIKLVNGSVDVVGTGTAFKSEVRFSDILLVNGVLTEIVRVESDTSLKLATPWSGASINSTTFAVIRNLTNASNYDLMKKIENFLTDRQRTLDEFVDWINAEPVTTGAADAGKFPMTDRYGVTVYLKSPRQLDYEHNLRVQQQEDLIDETQAALTDAEARLLAIGNQQTWADQILGYKNAAAASATLAQKWAENPENTAVVTGQFSAKHHALKAAASATSASSSATSATASKNAAATSETNAAASATTASTKASEAATSATNAAGSATGAANSATAAQTAKNAAEAAKTAAETAKTAAETARAGAQTAEANAASSASSAQTSSNTARDWAEKTGGPVSGGQYSAKHHATAAANSAADAQTRQNDVITRQNDVITRQTDVTNRQSNVVSLEASATSSKNAAAASATTASTKATEASTSASAAATSATAASASEVKAGKWAEEAVDVAVETGKFSAKHHATKAATSASNAASSATSASTSRTAAETAKTDAETAKTAAESAKTAAKTSETNAKTSETNAKTSETNAASSATAAANSAAAAATSKTGADTAKTAAEAAKTAAQTSETNAASSASAAASSASASATSANTSKDWAEKTTGPVTGSQYSAKYHSQQAQAAAADVTAKQTDIIDRQADVQTRQSNVVSLESSALSSKNAAAASATTASTKATEASTSATNASTSATNALASEVKAGKWAEEAENVTVETGKYSAKHHALKAAVSATSAASSATTATTARTQAQTAQTAAETARNQAQTAQTAAGTARNEAQVARDQAVTAASALTGNLVEFGGVNLSGGVYPTKPSSAGFWKVTVGGVVSGVEYGVGDTLVYSKNLDEFYKIDNTESVSSINGKTGAVTITAADVGALAAAGTAAAATKLATARTISLTGDATGSVVFDGTANASIAVTVTDNGHAHTIDNVAGLQSALDAKQGSLGYTPVQQGTGTGQGANIVKIGWSGSGLLLQVDATDFANNWPISISKNAATATKLATSRTINGVAFDGSANITIADSTKEPAITAGGTVHYWRGDKTWRDFATDVRAAALTGLSVSTNAAIAATDSILVAAGKLQAQITALANQQAASAGSADKLTTARTISLTGDASGSVAFDGSANVSIAVTVTDNSHNHVIGNVDGLQAALDAKAPLVSPSFTGATSMTGGAHAPWAELRSNGGTPFLDFSNDASTDFDVRLILSSDDLLELHGGSFRVNGEQYVTGWVRSTGSNGIYWESYGGGWHMTDTTWMRCYGGKPLYVANQIAATGNITAYYSDERLKENIRPIENALESVLSLKGVRYNANELAETFGYNRSKQEVGLLAGEVKKVLPEAVELAPFDVSEDPNVSKSGENYLTLKYERLVPLLVEAIKELKAELDELKAEKREAA